MIIAKVQFDKMVLIAYLEDMTSQDTLPERLLPQCLDILRKLSSGERDLIRVVVEIYMTSEMLTRMTTSSYVPFSNLIKILLIHRLQRGQSLEAGGDVDETPMVPRTPRPPKTPEDMTPEEQEATVVMDLRCLSLCIGLLERVNSVRCFCLSFFNNDLANDSHSVIRR